VVVTKKESLRMIMEKTHLELQSLIRIRCPSDKLTLSENGGDLFGE